MSINSWMTSRSWASLPQPDLAPGGWGWRILVLQAALALLLARLLIACLRFGRWRRLLGTASPAPGRTAPAAAGSKPLHPRDARLAAAVERAAARLPLTLLCLPRAMALHWLLRRDRRPGALLFGTLPGSSRGTLDDLHAWIECDGAVLIGASERPYNILARFVFIRN